MESFKNKKHELSDKLNKGWKIMKMSLLNFGDLNDKCQHFYQEFDLKINKLLDTVSSFIPGKNEDQIIANSTFILYEKDTKFKEIASVVALTATEIEIRPYDKGIMKNVEAALWKLNLGTITSLDNTLVLKLTSLTKDSMLSRFKKLKEFAEDLKNSMRLHKQSFTKVVHNVKDKSKDLSKQLDQQITNTLSGYSKLVDVIVDEFYIQYVK